MEAVLIFPHQLFQAHPCLSQSRIHLLIEDPHFFSDLPFHKHKLILHRATLKNFESYLKRKGNKTLYIEGDFSKQITSLGITTIYVPELDDVFLEKKLHLLARKFKIKLEVLPSPGFLTSVNEFKSLYKNKKKFRFETFYIYQRKKLNILIDDQGKPVGGKWSFDRENRSKIPRSLSIPVSLKIPKTAVVKEAIQYVEKKFPNNPGNSAQFSYPTTHAGAEKALQDFLQNRLHLFGDYEDAIEQDEKVLFHSCLSPLINIGLLTPDQVIEETLQYSQNHPVPLNSLEGFIRQVIGWREYIRGVYHAVGDKQRKSNFFKHTRKLPDSFYQATTGILPLDETIKKLNASAYLHHIERLMIVGNFFLLCEIDPEEIYKWFMELFIDAYDWVMVPNVYGMSQFSDGGMITTKPYFSSSNYILKMSHYPRGEWCAIWDSLFWRFMSKHSSFFKKQPRLSVLFKKAQEKKKILRFFSLAEKFLKELK